MPGLENAVLVGIAVLIGGIVAWKTRLPAPLVLLAIGVALSYVPKFGDVELPPDVVLFVFLPALLYWEAINTSAREVRRNLRVVLLSAIPLVIVTAAAVAVVGRFAMLPWAVAIALGAIIAPTDATAVGPVTGRLPRRTRTILRAESLINDGTALTIYAIAVEAVTAKHDIDFGGGTLLFLIAYAGGIAVGVGVAVVVGLVRRFLNGQSLLENTVSVLTPFLAYLPAERAGVSGVIAVVTCGLVLGHSGPRLVSARTRVQATGFWQLASGVINGLLFLLVGLQAHRVITALGADPMPVLGLGLVLALVVIAVRLGWVNTTPYLIRAIDRRPAQRARRVGARQRFVTGWAGFRGAVSLAAALALPNGFAFRSELIALTLVVIVVTLVVQGLTMPAVIRFGRLPEDPSEHEEELLASRTMTDAGARYLDAIAERLGTPPDVVASVRHQYEQSHPRDSTTTTPAWSEGSEGELRRALIAKKREAVIRLRDSGDIDDAVLRRMQGRLDIEELRLAPAGADD